MLLPLKSTPSVSAKQLETGLVGAKVPDAMIVEAGVIQKLCECPGLVILVVGVCPISSNASMEPGFSLGLRLSSALLADS